MGWRDKIGPEARQHLYDLRKTMTILTEPPDQGGKEPQDPSFVSIVSESRKSINENEDPPLSTIGEKDNQNPSIVSIVSDSQHLSGSESVVPIPENPVTKQTELSDQNQRESADSPPFSIGEKVSYQRPTFPAYGLEDRTPPPTWETRVGIVQGFDSQYELMAITDGQGGVVQVAKCYVQQEEIS